MSFFSFTLTHYFMLYKINWRLYLWCDKTSSILFKQYEEYCKALYIKFQLKINNKKKPDSSVYVLYFLHSIFSVGILLDLLAHLQ